jgi:hypothetical protein
MEEIVAHLKIVERVVVDGARKEDKNQAQDEPRSEP